MILTDREIRAHLENGQIIIEPRPDDTSYSATTVDLTLSNEINEWISDPANPSIIHPGRPGYKLADVIATYTRQINMSAGYILKPQSLLHSASESNR
jgi:deoxycytidine triphosphate deaminase